MISGNDLAGELLDLGKAIGLFDGSGNLQTSWFDNPLNSIESLLSDSTQRAAFLDLLNALLPPAQVTDVSTGESWHPLLGDQPRGNAYLTVQSNGSVTFGFAGLFQSDDTATPLASLRAHLPIVSFSGSTVSAIAGTSDGPLEFSLRLHLGWRFGTDPLGLDSVVVDALLAPLPPGSASANLVITLEQLQLDTSGPKDVVLDPNNLTSEAVQLITGLLHEKLSRLAGPTGEAASLVNHLLPLLGFGTDGIPQFPFAQLGDPSALNNWFASLLQGSGTPPIVAWLGHLAGLLGAGGTTVSGSGTLSDPWTVMVLPIGSVAGSGVSLTLATQTVSSLTSLLPGLAVTIVPGGANPPLRIEAAATIASIPIVGVGSATILPAASITAIAPGDAASGDLVSNATITVASAEAGLAWNGSALQPLLELLNVTLLGTHYDKLDLTNTDSVAQAATAAVKAALMSAIGSTGPGAHLAALAGIVPPANDSTSPHSVDLVAMVANPAQAIGAFHRSVLLDATHNWSFLLEEITALAGITNSVSGSGTRNDPWRVSLAAPGGAIDIELAAWNAQTSGVANDPQKLRLGLRAGIPQTAWNFWWLCELLAFDLPQTGSGTVSLMAGQEAHAEITSVPSLPNVGGLSISVGDFSADMSWTPGQSMMWSSGLDNIQVSFAGASVTVASLKFPSAAAFNVSNPSSIAAALGVSVGDLETLLRLMLARAAYSWGGMQGFALAGLLGVHAGLPGVQSDWPMLADPGAAGSLLSDPFTALRNWLAAIAVNTSSDGSAFLPVALSSLRAFLTGAVPSSPGAALPSFGLPLSGSGTYDDPWTLPLTSDVTSSLDALVWLEPAGPPPAWAKPLINAATTAADLPSLIAIAQQLGAFVPDLAAAFKNADAGLISGSLVGLDDYFSSSDGVVPLISAVPTSGSWTAGTTLSSAHPALPADPSAIQQILAQIDTWAGGAGSSRTVLLLGPAFSDHTIWQTLLGNGNLHGTTDPTANFNLRVPGLDPSAVGLTTVTANVNYYTADLNDDGTGDLTSLTAQIARVVARIQQLTSATQVVLVGHSTAGVAARAFTAANPALVAGLITLGSPHLGADLPYFDDPYQADAVRAAQSMRPSMPAGALRDAFDHVVQALDGYLASSNPAQLPTASPYPIGSFADPGSTDTGGRPALALGSQLPGALLGFFQTTFSALATAAANPVTTPPAPTHLAFGVRSHLDFYGTVTGQYAVNVSLRADAFRIALQKGAADPPRPAYGLAVRAQVTNPDGWLVGASGAFAGVGLPQVDVRVKWMEMGVDITSGTGGMTVTPQLGLHQVSFHGPVSASAAWNDINAQALFGAVFQKLSNPAPLAGSNIGLLLDVLTNLGVAVADPHGGVGVSADAFAAIQSDAAGYLSSKLAAAFDAGIPGFSGPAGGPWSSPLGILPVEVYLSQNPWTVGVRTSAGVAYTLAGSAGFVFDGSVTLPNFQPKLDAGFLIGALTLMWSSATNQLTADASPWLGPLTLIPAPSPGTVEKALNDALPRLLFSSAASAIFESLMGPGFKVPPLDLFFSSTSSVMSQPSAVGNSGGNGLDSARITQLLQIINNALGFPAGPGLSLPGGLQLTASGAGTDASPTTLQLATTSAIGGVVGVTAGVSFDSTMHITPSGNVSLTIGLPGTGWGGVVITFGASASGVSLVVAPQATGVAPIQILPTFSGLGALAGAAEALLPQALDALVGAIGTSTIMTLVLDVAAAFNIYDSVGGFAAHADELKTLLQTNWLAGFNSAEQTAAANAIASLFSGTSPLAGVLPGTVSATSGTVKWALPLGGSDSGNLALTLGWDGSGPTVLVGLSSVKLGDGALAIDAAAGYAKGNIAISTGFALHLENAIGIALAPTLMVSETGGKFQLEFYPLADGTANGPITIDLLPPAVHMGAGGAIGIVNQWLIPLVADMLFTATQSSLNSPLWTGGPTLQAVLIGSHVAQSGGGGVVVNPSIPDISTIITGLISTLVTGVSIAITDTINLALANDGGRLGVRIYGAQAFDIGNYSLSLLFGAPTDWGSNFDTGAAVYLFDSSGGNFTFNPGMIIAGLGLGLTGQDDAPLINTDGFRLGGARLYSFFHAEFGSGFTFDSLGAGVELDALGLPLGQATGGNVGGNNPVAASLLQSDGGDNDAGDTQSVNPALDVAAWYWSAPTGDATFHILFQDNNQPIWIGVHAQFGPIYIEQIGLVPNGNTSCSMVLDASVKIDGLTGEVDELGVTIPYKSITTPGDWTLDLKGIALGFQSPEVTIAGALLKNDSGPAIEYDGMLLVQVTEFGIVAVGAYSKPTDAQGGYTSIFIFAGVFIIIGIPPIIEIDAFGLGVGYNRELIVPDDMNKIPSFVLVAALDDGGAMANDPMGELMQISTSMPAKRGSFWLAVGLHGTTFVIVHVTAIVYVALDSGMEIGLIGVARMAIPSDDTALVSVELALKARYSSAEGVLSIQAQLTDNSYLLAPDCQLTGGFAYFMWFPEGQFVLTLGGYNPHFQVPTQFPNVPRLGFNWGLPIGATIKGQSYFALTNTCIMAGARLDLTWGASCANVWFTAYADFLISWDPFYYNIDIGISVGASLSITICFFGCVTIGISISIGATLTIEGPPLHGTATLDLDVCSLTVSFGPDPNPQPDYISDWGTFATKYLYGGDPNGNAFAVNVLTGLAPPEPSGGQPAPGTEDKPWKLTSEFSFQCDTKMPATVSNDFVFGDQTPNVHSIDLAPMNKESVDSRTVITLQGKNGSGWTTLTLGNSDPRFNVDELHWSIAPTVGKVSEATWHWNDPTNMPAAANTLPAITNVQIVGFAVTEGQSVLIPIAKLIFYGNSRPLPFAVPWDITTFKSYGTGADSLAVLGSQLNSGSTLSIASQVLSGGSGFFSQQRVASGLPENGLQPMAVRALKLNRSAPPLLTPLSTGLTMKPVGLANPPVIVEVPPVAPVPLQAPRLRAVLQARPQPVADTPPALRTSVTKVAAAANVARMAAPQVMTVASRLQRVPAPNAARATRLASASRTIRSTELAWTSGAAPQEQVTNAEQDLGANGVSVPAGTTHLWDVPAGASSQFVVTGSAAFRITFLTRGGSVISDSEYAAGNSAGIAVPARCGMVAITCLGVPPTPLASLAPAFGAVSFAAAPAGQMVATGWELHNLLPQVGATSILGRGACVLLPQTHSPARKKQAVSSAMVNLSDALATQAGVETWLPATTGVVMILLDQQDPSAAADGDLGLAVNGATLSTSPIRILGGRRRALLYDVQQVTTVADHITVAVASLSGWRFSGVIGLSGKAQEWGVRFNGKIPEQLVPDGPLTPNGSVTVRMVSAPGGTS